MKYILVLLSCNFKKLVLEICYSLQLQNNILEQIEGGQTSCRYYYLAGFCFAFFLDCVSRNDPTY